MTDQKINMTDACLCKDCGLYKLGDDGIKSCTVIKLAAIMADGGECPICGTWVESRAEKEKIDREWKQIENMSAEECKVELEGAGIDVKEAWEKTRSLIKVCKQVNDLKGELSEKEESVSLLKKEVERLENENLQLKRRARSEFLRDVGALD